MVRITQFDRLIDQKLGLADYQSINLCERFKYKGWHDMCPNYDGKQDKDEFWGHMHYSQHVYI